MKVRRQRASGARWRRRAKAARKRRAPEERARRRIAQQLAAFDVRLAPLVDWMQGLQRSLEALTAACRQLMEAVGDWLADPAEWAERAGAPPDVIEKLRARDTVRRLDATADFALAT